MPKCPLQETISPNTVLDTEGKRILYHTWYAGSYGKSEKRTSRIDSDFLN